MKSPFFKKHKHLCTSICVSSILASAGCATLAAQLVLNEPVYRREIPAEMLKLSDDGTILYGFADNITVLDIARPQYNVLVVPETVTRINESAFALMFDGFSCDVCEIDFDTNIESIGDNAFFKDWGITRIVFNETSDNPSHLKSIGKEAFSTCGIKGDITFPSRLENIGENAFYLCEDIFKIKLPASLTTMGYRAFACNYKLGLIDLLEYDSTPEWIYHASQSFYNIGSSLTQEDTKDVLVSTKNNSVAEWAQALQQKQSLPNDSTNTFSIVGNEKIVPLSYFDIEKKIKDTKIEYILKGVKDDIETWINDYDVLQIPSEVTTIKTDVFSMKIPYTARCTLVLGGNLQIIETEAFSGCWGLVGSLQIPYSVREIGDNAFAGCCFTSVEMAPLLTKVGTFAFAPNPLLTWCSINCLPDAETFRDGRQFVGCPSLQFIDFTPIGNDLPEALSELKDDKRPFWNGYVMPTGYISISPEAAWVKQIADPKHWNFSCYSNTDPTYPWYNYQITGNECQPEFIDVAKFNTIVKGMTSEGIENLLEYDTINIPTTSEIIVDNAFNGLFNRDFIKDEYHFWEVVLNDGLEKIGDKAFYQCSGLQQKQFYLPKTLKTIGNEAFAECTDLRGQLALPQNLRSIGNNAFLGCTGFSGLLELHGNMSIGDGAFTATSFSSVIFDDDKPLELGSKIFALTNTIKTIDLVPCQFDRVKQWKFQPDSLFIDTPSTEEDELVVYVNDATPIESWKDLLHNQMGLPQQWEIKTPE